jgi:Predicted ATPases involved in biogenesis of archaeal flagella
MATSVDAQKSVLEMPDQSILSTGNSELDKKIADGLPLQSLTLIEGENDTGKSVLTQQIIWGALKQGSTSTSSRQRTRARVSSPRWSR